jgi:hypothetical protein
MVTRPLRLCAAAVPIAPQRGDVVTIPSVIRVSYRGMIPVETSTGIG